jgi:hypothetical protein
MNSKKYETYLYDLGILLKEKARGAKIDRDNAIDTKDYDYNLGYLMAFHEVISIMKQQADVFDIHQKNIGLNDIEPEADLL